MLSHCLKCRKNTESENSKVVKTKNGRIMLLSKCAVCDSKKSRFIKEQKASGLLSSLGLKTLLSRIPLVGSDVSRPFGRPVNRFGCPNSGAQKRLFKFTFFSCISTKNALKEPSVLSNASNYFEMA